MDYSTFCDDNFDLQTWVNTALQSEQNPNTLVMKLQLLMQVHIIISNINSQLMGHNLTQIADWIQYDESL